MKYEQKIDMDETEEVPKSQRILNKKNVRQLKILGRYLITYLILIIIATFIYIFSMLYWDNYFNKQNNLTKLLAKNINLETSIYRAINLYYMMVFNNLTSNFATEILYPSIYNESETLCQIFRKKKQHPSFNSPKMHYLCSHETESILQSRRSYLRHRVARRHSAGWHAGGIRTFRDSTRGGTALLAEGGE